MFAVFITLSSFLLSAAAAVFIKRKQISVNAIILIFLFAFFATAAAGFLQYGASFSIQLFFLHFSFKKKILLDSFFYTGFLEEITKLLFFLLFIKLYYKEEDDIRRHNQISLISVLYGSVFASFENISYSVLFGMVVLIRFITANIIHAGLSYYYVQISTAKKRLQKIYYFFTAWFLHGIYNMFLNMGGFFTFFAVIVVLYSGSHIIKSCKAP